MTADQQNSCFLIVSITLLLFWLRKLVLKNVSETNGKQLNIESGCISVQQKRRLLRLLGTVFVSKVASLLMIRKKNLIILQFINKLINWIEIYLPLESPIFVCPTCLGEWPEVLLWCKIHDWFCHNYVRFWQIASRNRHITSR